MSAQAAYRAASASPARLACASPGCRATHFEVVVRRHVHRAALARDTARLALRVHAVLAVQHERRAARTQLCHLALACGGGQVDERAREQRGAARGARRMRKRQRVVAGAARDEAAREGAGVAQSEQLVHGAAGLEAASHLFGGARASGKPPTCAAGPIGLVCAPPPPVRHRLQRCACPRTCSDSSLKNASQAPAALSQGEGSSGVMRTCGAMRAAAAVLAAAMSATSWGDRPNAAMWFVGNFVPILPSDRAADRWVAGWLSVIRK